MNERLKHQGKAMEGRAMRRDGTDLGDRHFHEVGWNTTPDAAREDLARIADADAELAERQAEAFAKQDATLGIAAFKGLLEIYRDHPNVGVWSRRIEELERG